MTNLDEKFTEDVKKIKEKIPEGSTIVGKQFSLNNPEYIALVIRNSKGEIEVFSL